MKNYLPFWLLLLVSFAIIFILSAFDDVSIGSYQPKSSGFYETLIGRRKVAEQILPISDASDPVNMAFEPAAVDTTAKTICSSEILCSTDYRPVWLPMPTITGINYTLSSGTVRHLCGGRIGETVILYQTPKAGLYFHLSWFK